MKCNYCGTDNPQEAEVCQKCGEELVKLRTVRPKKKHNTHQPDEETPESAPQPVRGKGRKGKAASPNEYFFDETYYGETQPYSARAERNRRQPQPPYNQPQNGYNRQPYYDPRYVQSYPPQPAPLYRKSRVPYLIVSYLTALLSIFCFVLPYREWVSFDYQLLGVQVSQGNLSLSELAKRFYENDTLQSLVIGTENEYIAGMIPDSVSAQYAKGRLVALAVAVIFLVALVFFVLFIISVLVRLRGASIAFGVIGSLLYALGSLGVMTAVRIINEIVIEYDDVSWNFIRFKLLDGPYVGLAVAAILFVMCIIFGILSIGTKRRY